MAGERTKMAAGARRHLLTVAMSPGPQADGMADGIAVMDSQNVESLPDGSGVCNRRGSRFYLSSKLAGKPGVLRLLLNGKVPRTGAPLFAVVGADGSASAVAKWPYSNGSDYQGGESFFEPTCNVTYGVWGGGEFAIYVPPPAGSTGLAYTIPIRRDGDLSFACAVHFELMPNPAYSPDDPMFLVAGTDYDATTGSGTVTFAAGEAEKTISVTFYEAAWVAATLRQITVKMTGAEFCVTPSPYGGDNCAYLDLIFLPALSMTRMATGLTAKTRADDNGLARAMVWRGDGIVGVYLRATKPGQVVE